MSSMAMRTESELLQAAHQFLLEMNREARVFTKDEFRRAVNSDEMFERHWLTGFSAFLAKVDDGGQQRFVVGSAFGGCLGKEEFERRIHGMEKEGVAYSFATHLAVINYEFFMPVVHEGKLKKELDSLFYKDALLERVRALGLAEVQCHFPRDEKEGETDYLERLCRWLGGKFGGYSMSKVDGRFRMSTLKTQAEAFEGLARRGEQYLADEETVVVRFIFRCGQSAAPCSSDFDGRCDLPSAQDDRAIKRDAYLVQYFFWKLFVESITKAVNGEAEIWLVESGLRSCLHIWSRTAGSMVIPGQNSDDPWYRPILRPFGLG
jgi:hypothetical protein